MPVTRHATSLADLGDCVYLQNTFHAPADKMNQAYNDVMAYLDSVELVPSTESLIK